MVLRLGGTGGRPPCSGSPLETSWLQRWRVGAVLRCWSLDELPQLLHVLERDMSLVGPRPPLVREVEECGQDVPRLFLVNPGFTGLWQVSGRSDLSWDDSVRMDLRYVESGP